MASSYSLSGNACQHRQSLKQRHNDNETLIGRGILGDNSWLSLMVCGQEENMKTTSNLLVFIGIISLAIALTLNFYGSYAASNAGSAPLFSTNWWARWFPLYASGSALLFAGLVLRLIGKTRQK